MPRQGKLPITGRPLPPAQPFPHVAEWMDEQATYNPKTAKTYITPVRAFADWLASEAIGIYSLNMPWPMPITDLKNAHFFEFKRYYEANRSKSTAKTYAMGLLSYFKYLWAHNLCPDGINVGDIDMRLRIDSRRSKANAHSQSVTVTQKDAMRQQVPLIVKHFDQLEIPAENDHYNHRLTALRDRAMMRVLFDTAVRISELATLKVSDIQAGWAPLITGKGGKPRTIHIRKEKTQAAIMAYVIERDDDYPALFISHSRNSYGSGVSITTIHTTIKAAIDELGLNKKISAHDFRHYRATQLLRDGMPLEVLQEYLGHADVTTTRNIYAPVLGAKIVDDWLDKIDNDDI